MTNYAGKKKGDESDYVVKKKRDESGFLGSKLKYKYEYEVIPSRKEEKRREENRREEERPSLLRRESRRTNHKEDERASLLRESQRDRAREEEREALRRESRGTRHTEEERASLLRGESQRRLEKKGGKKHGGDLRSEGVAVEERDRNYTAKQGVVSQKDDSAVRLHKETSNEALSQIQQAREEYSKKIGSIIREDEYRRRSHRLNQESSIQKNDIRMKSSIQGVSDTEPGRESVEVTETNKREVKASSQVLSGRSSIMESKTGFSTQEVSDSGIQRGFSLQHELTPDRPPQPQHKTHGEARRDEVLGLSSDFTSHEDALGSAARLQKSSTEYVGEFVEGETVNFKL
ncbi:hypothetical protein HAX54_013894 [Datura stramonium]|uniref:Uncharacterized protein n=1 Tax=Datura stramonium TaxID=4076 RepID=A0ABS8TN23_DATST|nr:hypothetical protein [Datura stramonium]